MPVILTLSVTVRTMQHRRVPLISMELTRFGGQTFVSIGILLFPPVDFPAQQLPAALQAVHRVRPVEAMTEVVRWSLTGQYVASPLSSFALVSTGAWAPCC